MSVSAGHITLEVREGRNGARYQLGANGVTADWVSTFFRADDQFISQVDGQLRPLVFEQHLKEDSRVVVLIASCGGGNLRDACQGV